MTIFTKILIMKQQVRCLTRWKQMILVSWLGTRSGSEASGGGTTLAAVKSVKTGKPL